MEIKESSLTKKQGETLEFIKKFMVSHGYPPSVREICAGMGLSSPATAHTHLKELESKNGWIDDEVVYHWAREYFVDGIAEKEKAEKVQKQVEKMSDLSKVKVNKDISEDRKERMRQALSKAKAELHQQEFDF